MSDKTTRRGIYLYLDGQEVTNNVKSISAEMKKLQAEQAKMTIGSDEYVAHGKKIQAMNGILAEHRASLKATGDSWFSISKIADGMNKYFAGILAVGAAITGITMKLQEYRKAALELQDAEANLKALTGLDDAGVQYLTDQSKKLSTSITEDGVRITESAKDIEDGFTKMGSKRPELLKNKEALAEVTKEALTLAAAGKMQAEPAFEALAATMNQFNLGADQAKRAINVLGAGALAGSAEVSDLSDSLKNVGAVANGANLSLEQTVGALEVLAEKQLVGEEAGTKLRGAIIKMQAAGLGYASGSFVFRDALTELQSKLKGLHTEMERDALMHQTFGLENITAGKILVSNVAEYDKMTTAVTGTNVAIEQAVINTSTMSAKLAQAKNEMQLAGMQLADKLAPAFYTLTSGTRDFVKALVVVVNWMGEHKTTILLTTTAIAAWTIAAKAHLIIEKLTSETVKSNIIVMNIRAAGIWLMTKANIAATESELALMAATKEANMAMKSNIWGFIAVAAFTAIGYITDYLKKTKEVNALDDATTNIKKKISEQYDDQATKVKSLIDILHNESNALSVRKDALEQLKKLAPDYHADLTKEGKLINDNTDALDAYLANLEKKIKMDAYQDELTKALKTKTQMERWAQPGYEASLTPEDKAWNEKHKITTGAFKNDQNGITAYLQKSKEYVDNLKVIKSLMDDIQGINPISDVPEDNKNPSKDNQNDGGSKTSENKKAMDFILENLETEHQKRINKIKEKYASGEIKSESDYNNQLMQEDYAYYTLKEQALEASLKKTTDKELRSNIEKQIAEVHKKRIDEEIAFRAKIQKIILDADPEKAENQAYDERLRDVGLFNVKKEDLIKKIDETTNKEEKARLEEQLTALEMLEKQHSDNLLKIKKDESAKRKAQAQDDFDEAFKTRKDQLDEEIRAQENIANLAKKSGTPFSEFSNMDSDPEIVLQKMKIAAIKEEIAARIKAGTVTSKILDEQAQAEGTLTELYLSEFQKRSQLYSQFGDQIGTTLGAVINGNHDALKSAASALINMGLDFLKKEMEMAIVGAQIQSLATPDSVLTFGASGFARAALLTGLIEAAFAAAKAVIGNNLYTGGFTPDGAWDQPQGIVHSNEFVANRFATSNPTLRPVLDMINMAQQTGTVANLKPNDIVKAVRGSSSISSLSTTSKNSTSVQQGSNYDAELMNIIRQSNDIHAKLIKKLDEPIVSYPVISGQKGLAKQTDRYNKLMQNASRQ